MTNTATLDTRLLIAAAIERTRAERHLRAKVLEVAYRNNLDLRPFARPAGATR